MSTKEKLKQYIWIKRNIEKLECRLLEIESELEKSTTCVSSDASGTGGLDKFGDLISAKIEIQENINLELLKSYKALSWIEKTIAKLNSIEQYLMGLRYIEGKSWRAISKEMGYESAQVYRIHSAALDSLIKHDSQ